MSDLQSLPDILNPKDIAEQEEMQAADSHIGLTGLCVDLITDS